MLSEIYLVAGGVGFIYIVGTSLLGFLNDGGDSGAGGDSGDAGGDSGDAGGTDAGDAGGDSGDVGCADASDVGGDSGDVGGADASDFGGDAVHGRVAQTGAQFRVGLLAKSRSKRFSPALLLLKIISPSTLTTFGFFFGLTGFMLLHYLPWLGIWSLAPAIVCGWLGYTIMNRITAAITSKMHVSTTFDERDMIGHTAEITVPISKGSLGEVTYTANGIRTTAPARSASEQAFKTTSMVIITDIKDGIILVEECPEELKSIEAS